MTIEPPPPVATAPEIDRRRVLQQIDEQRNLLAERTPRSGEYFERARRVMPKGVPSSFQENEPWPVYIERGTGAQVWDVDGNEYVDFHNGFGVMCVGHANPVIAAAVKHQVDHGTHFAAPTEGSISVAEELTRRFGLPQWRFTNSGTESTMDAIHVARGATGRDVVLKIEGSYHGHHDAVMVSVYPPLEALGARDDPHSVPYGAGYPKALTDLTRAVPFNDADALASVLDKLEGKVAALIMEPAMMNINIIPPVDGYLEKVRRLTADHGVVLVFDEVKTGATISPGGATQRFGVTARRDHAREGDLRRAPRRRDRHDRRARRRDRRRHRAPVRNLQRQPARDGGGARDADRGARARGLRAARAHERAHAARLRRDHRALPPALLHRGPRREGMRRVLRPSGCTSTGTTSRRSTTTCRRSPGSST